MYEAFPGANLISERADKLTKTTRRLPLQRLTYDCIEAQAGAYLPGAIYELPP